MKKIAMIVAMDKELKEYFETLGNVVKLEGYLHDVWYAKVYEKELYIIKSGIGELAAAAATQYMITAFHVDLVINFGICGNLSKDLRILDTVVVEKVVHYQFDLSAIDNVPPAAYYGSEIYINSDIELINRLVEIDPSVKKAICASGDKFIAKPEDKAFLRKEYNADICEMEAAGILITCNKNQIACIMIKSVSDDCNEMDFATYCEKAAAKHVDLIAKLVEVL